MVEAFRERAIPPPSFSDLCERLVQIGDYIVDVLGSDGEPDRGRRDPLIRQLLGGEL